MRLGLVLVGAALCASAAATPRPGKVVRIERGGKRITGTPRYCAIMIGNLQAFCYGKKPEVGEHITVVDFHHVIGVLRVESADSNCPQQQTPLWTTHVQVESGDFQSPEPEQIGLIDVTVDPRVGHLMKLDRVPGDRVIRAEQIVGVDSDGDSNPDLAFQAFACDDDGNPTPTGPIQCYEVLYANGHSLEHLRTDRIPMNCN